MSYEIPTLIGSLVDRAIRWEKNLDPLDPDELLQLLREAEAAASFASWVHPVRLFFND